MLFSTNFAQRNALGSKIIWNLLAKYRFVIVGFYLPKEKLTKRWIPMAQMAYGIL
jgi:hypothetical protein